MDAGKRGYAADGRRIERHGRTFSGQAQGTITTADGAVQPTRPEGDIGTPAAADRPRSRQSHDRRGASDVELSLASPYGSIRRGRLRDNAAESWPSRARRVPVDRGRAAAVDGRIGGTGGAVSARLGAGTVGSNWVADRIVGRAAVVGGGQSVPCGRGRHQPRQASRGGGPDGGRLDAPGGARRQRDEAASYCRCTSSIM